MEERAAFTRWHSNRGGFRHHHGHRLEWGIISALSALALLWHRSARWHRILPRTGRPVGLLVVQTDASPRQAATDALPNGVGRSLAAALSLLVATLSTHIAVNLRQAGTFDVAA